MYFLINETLEECARERLDNADRQYVAIITSAEWRRNRDNFDLGIDLELDTMQILNTKAYVNYDSLTGAFCLPDRNNISGEDLKFAFALDEKGIVFIDDSGAAENIVRKIQRTKKWRLPGLERFLYDFLDQIIRDDLAIMEGYERELDKIEKEILDEGENISSKRVNEIRSDIRDIRINYEQLMDFSEVLEENENNFFKTENLRYFHMFSDRIARHRDIASSLRDYTMQIRDLYKAHLDIKQNRIMTVLTVVTTIFMPLTLIAGWYGMNFQYMPELGSKLGYPLVIAVSIVIVAGSLIFFKKKKWL